MSVTILPRIYFAITRGYSCAICLSCECLLPNLATVQQMFESVRLSKNYSYPDNILFHDTDNACILSYMHYLI